MDAHSCLLVRHALAERFDHETKQARGGSRFIAAECAASQPRGGWPFCCWAWA